MTAAECVCGEPKGLHYPDCPLYPKWWRRRDELRAALAERVRAAKVFRDDAVDLADAIAMELLPAVLSYGEQQRRAGAVEALTAGFIAAAHQALTLGRRGPNAIADWLLDFGQDCARAEAAAENTDQR